MISICKLCKKYLFITLVCSQIFLSTASVYSQTYQLKWFDEFNGSNIDTNNWSFQIGDGTSEGLPAGWGNNELQYYRQENARVEDGNLFITAKKESFGGYNYTSTRMQTLNKADFLYGKIEANMKLPKGKGIWPAFWMLPTDWVYGGWAASGEIDIMEAVNIPTEIHGTIHYGGAWPNNVLSGGVYSEESDSNVTDFSDDFHVYTLEWEPNELRWYVDGNLYSTKTQWWSAGGDYPAPFNQKFHILVNLAVGGNWPGTPDQTTVFPQEFIIDWIRVYQLETETGTGKLDEMKDAPNRFLLNQNFPNPFNPSTNISYSLPKAHFVTLKVYDILGKEIESLVNGYQSAGHYSVTFNNYHLSSGIYLYKIQVGDFGDVKRMTLSR